MSYDKVQMVWVARGPIARRFGVAKGTVYMEVIEPDGKDIEDFLRSTGDQVERSADRIYVYSKQCQTVQSAFRGRFPDTYSTIRPSTLEDVFLRLTGRRLRE